MSWVAFRRALSTSVVEEEIAWRRRLHDVREATPSEYAAANGHRGSSRREAAARAGRLTDEQRVRRDAEDVPSEATLFDLWLSDQPGHPLGHGMPMGATLRLDGESHSDAWRRILRADPCAYCGGAAGTVDHVRPKARRTRDTERWTNLVGACGPCNSVKAARPLLQFLLINRDRLPLR